MKKRNRKQNKGVIFTIVTIIAILLYLSLKLIVWVIVLPFKIIRYLWRFGWGKEFVIGLSFIAMILFMGKIISHYDKMAQVQASKANLYQSQLFTQIDKQRSTEQENSELKEKLADASKVEVDDKTLQIVRYYLTKYFGKDAPTAEKVFTCESHLSPNAVHVNRPGLGQDVGVSQLNNLYQTQRFEKLNPGISFDNGAHDIDMNLKVAADIFHEQGWKPWMCSKIVHVY